VLPNRIPYKDIAALTPQGFIQYKLNNLTSLSTLLYGMAKGEEDPVNAETVRTPITDYLNQTNSSKAIARTYQ
jgi:hypothetical protein